ncbi:hypothetical protein OZ10_07315 [Xanthomonas cannabis pv. cannabis]|nr:hypothetical protein OZ10_07315 [Xanthomonas cannabis pv. cannabis]
MSREMRHTTAAPGPPSCCVEMPGAGKCLAWVGVLLDGRIRRLPGQRTIAAALRHGVDMTRHKLHKAMHAHDGDSAFPLIDATERR